jgi:hypothetical protein
MASEVAMRRHDAHTGQAGSSRRHRPALVALVVLVAALTMACSSGPERSAESFCRTLRAEKQRILDQLSEGSAAAEAQSDDLLGVMMGLGVTVQALEELRTYFHKLADVAPEEIRTEVELVRDEFDTQFENAGDAASDPLGSLATSIFGSMAVSGQLDAVNSYAQEHCGEGI